MKRQRIARLGVSLAVVLAGLLVFAEPASGGVSFRLSVGGRSGSHRGRSSYRSHHSGSRYRGSGYSGYRSGGYYRPYSYYRSPVVSRSYSTTYYTSSPYDSYYRPSSCGSCGASICGCGSTIYYSVPTTTYRTYTRYLSDGRGSGTVVRYIIVH